MGTRPPAGPSCLHFFLKTSPGPQSGPTGATAGERPGHEVQAGLTALRRTSGRDAQAAVERQWRREDRSATGFSFTLFSCFSDERSHAKVRIPVEREQKNGPSEEPRPMKCEGYLTSRGEQLLQRHWEETAMCISCVHYGDILIRWKTFIVQRTYAYAALLPKSGCSLGATVPASRASAASSASICRSWRRFSANSLAKAKSPP